jgi:hypothetical protein
VLVFSIFLRKSSFLSVTKITAADKKNKEDTASTLSESKWARRTVAILPAGAGTSYREAYAETKGFQSPGLSHSFAKPLKGLVGPPGLFAAARLTLRAGGLRPPFSRCAGRCSGRTWNQGINSLRSLFRFERTLVPESPSCPLDHLGPAQGVQRGTPGERARRPYAVPVREEIGHEVGYSNRQTPNQGATENGVTSALSFLIQLNCARPRPAL